MNFYEIQKVAKEFNIEDEYLNLILQVDREKIDCYIVSTGRCM
jgi:hypothetical protein